MRSKNKSSKILIAVTVFFVAGFGLAGSVQAGVVFEDDFSGSSGWSVPSCATANSGIQQSGPPNWSGYLCTKGGVLQVEPSAGVGGTKPAMRIAYPINWSAPTGYNQPTMSLYKHLTGDVNVGYNELYVRYKFKMDDDFQVGTDGRNHDYWKWIRLWQNTEPTNYNPKGISGTWSESYPEGGGSLHGDKRYFISNFHGASGIPYGSGCLALQGSWNTQSNSSSNPGTTLTFVDQANSSVSGCWKAFNGMQIQQPTDAYPGYFVGCTPTSCNAPQTWHTIEYRSKLATTSDGGLTSNNDGIVQIWFDGVEQTGKYSTLDPIPSPRPDNSSNSQNHPPYFNPNADPAHPDWFNTLPYSCPGGGAPCGASAYTHGGYNFLVVFDNMMRWNAGWAAPKGLYLNDVVVSTSRIGESYVVGGGSSDTTSPAAPTGLAVQ